MDNMESATDDELIRRNERLLNLRELDLEIKQRELDLALHLNDLQEREAALMRRKTTIGAELQYELALELARVEMHENEIRARHDALEVELRKREEALAKRELNISEREWTLRAKEDQPKGEMAKVYGALNLRSSDRPVDRVTAAGLKSGISAVVCASTSTPENSASESREQARAGYLSGLRGNDEVDNYVLADGSLIHKAPQLDSDLTDLVAKADDLRRHLAAARLSADLDRVMKMIDETVSNVMELNVKHEQNEFHVEADRDHEMLLEASVVHSTVAEAPVSTEVGSAFKEIKATPEVMLSADPTIRILQLEAQAERLKTKIRNYDR